MPLLSVAVEEVLEGCVDGPEGGFRGAEHKGAKGRGDHSLLDVENVLDDVGELVELLGGACRDEDRLFHLALEFVAILLRVLGYEQQPGI